MQIYQRKQFMNIFFPSSFRDRRGDLRCHFHHRQAGLLNLKYSPKEFINISNPFISFDYRITSRQDKIVPPEKSTPAYHLLNVSLGSQFKMKACNMNFNFQIQNLLNTRYLNHSSYYRLIGIPEQGRGFVFNLKLII
jgi:iron complex outermembrane recepter protein